MKRLSVALLILVSLPLSALANGTCVGRRGLAAPLQTFSAPSYSYSCYGCYGCGGGQPAQLPAPRRTPVYDQCPQVQQLPAYQPQYDMPSCAPQQDYQPQYDMPACAPQATPYAQAAFAPSYGVQRSFAPSYGYGVQRSFAVGYGVQRAFAPAYGVGVARAFAPAYGVGFAPAYGVGVVAAPVVVQQQFFGRRAFRSFGGFRGGRSGGFGGSGALFIRGRNFSFARF